MLDSTKALLIQKLRSFDSAEATSAFLDLLKDFFRETGLNPESPQLGITLYNKKAQISVNIGTRWVFGLVKRDVPLLAFYFSNQDLNRDVRKMLRNEPGFVDSGGQLQNSEAFLFDPLKSISSKVRDLWYKHIKNEVRLRGKSNVNNLMHADAVFLATHDKEIRAEVMNYVRDTSLPLPAQPHDDDFVADDSEDDDVYSGTDFKYAPGKNANLWSEHFDQGIIALGYGNSDPGPVDAYTDIESLKSALGPEAPPSLAKRLWKFCNAPIGSRIFANNGRNQVVGIGVISGPYYYVKEAEDFRHRRKVEWLCDKPLDLKKYVHELDKKSAFVIAAFGHTRHGDFIVKKYLEKYPEYRESFEKVFSITYPSNNRKLVDPRRKMSSNTILYGPPGTGKTWSTIDLAVEIVTGQNQEHAGNKIEFDRLRQEGQIEFITFHQNYSYEDFMVGLKPDVDQEILRFQERKGIFYEICRRARVNYEASMKGQVRKRTFDEVFSEIMAPLEQGKEVEITMKLQDKYAITDVTERSIAFRKPNGSTNHTMSISTLEDIVDGIRSMTSGLTSYYTPLSQLIIKKQGTAEVSAPPKNYVLIIDEINRGNISRIFGELITLLEEDKRIGQENELLITLTNGEKGFGVPPNLYIIGTMNTADKSIALLDIALRRRFDFLPKYPEYNKLTPYVAEKLEKLNAAILETKKSPDFMIGHAFFIKKADEEFCEIMNRKIVPLLYEYFNGREEFVRRILEKMEISIRQNTITQAWEVLPS